MKLLCGIDLGGTKIEGVIVEEQAITKPLIRKRIDTEQAQGAEHVINQIWRLYNDLCHEIGKKVEAVGISHPGTTDPNTKLLKNSGVVCLNTLPLGQLLEDKLKSKLVLANDANCFALAESIFGAGRTGQVVFGVIMGTGIGGGIVINQKCLVGAHGIAGEWGHNFLDADTYKCYCGKVGCVESIISGTALEKYYQNISGKFVKLNQIYKTIDSDPFAKKTIDRLLEFFGKAIANVINILDPDVIVLGGGVSNIDLIYQAAPQIIEKYVFNPCFDAKLVKHQLGDSAGVFGAALLARELEK